MSRIVIAGAGAFGTSLAMSLNRGGRDVTLMARVLGDMETTRVSQRLPGIAIPNSIKLIETLEVSPDEILLLAVPMQSLAGFLATHTPKPLAAIACCKGIDLETGRGPTAIIEDTLGCASAILTGPSFAKDIAIGLPTALTLATTDAKLGGTLQSALSTDTLRIYRSDDPTGAELGGALKNVVAIACGICIGAGLGESARAALMTRGYAEMVRLATALGAKRDTLAGLSGFGDLALTCSSVASRNFAYGHALGSGAELPQNTTVEGKATAKAVLKLAAAHGTDMPIAAIVTAMLDGHVSLKEALDKLLSRPLKKE